MPDTRGLGLFSQMGGCDLATSHQCLLSPFLPHEGVRGPLSSPERQKGRGGEREADQGLTHHSRDPSGGHAPAPEFCLTMSRMVACQEGSLAAGGMETREEMWSCPK